MGLSESFSSHWSFFSLVCLFDSLRVVSEALGLDNMTTSLARVELGLRPLVRCCATQIVHLLLTRSLNPVHLAVLLACRLLALDLPASAAARGAGVVRPRRMTLILLLLFWLLRRHERLLKMTCSLLRFAQLDIHEVLRKAWDGGNRLRNWHLVHLVIHAPATCLLVLSGRFLVRLLLRLKAILIDLGSLCCLFLNLYLLLHELLELLHRYILEIARASWDRRPLRWESCCRRSGAHRLPSLRKPSHNFFISIEFALLVRDIIRMTRLLVQLCQRVGSLLEWVFES